MAVNIDFQEVTTKRTYGGNLLEAGAIITYEQEPNDDVKTGCIVSRFQFTEEELQELIVNRGKFYFIVWGRVQPIISFEVSSPFNQSTL